VAVCSGEDGHEAPQGKPEQKALIVLQGLKGRSVGELGAEHETSPAQYDQWRELFLANAARAFERAGAPHRQARLGYRAPNVIEAEHLGHATPLAKAC
jgi:hypothetical protein